MKAISIMNEKATHEGFVLEYVIWQLSEPTTEMAHGYKYRLHYGRLDGTCIVRYDNRKGKGDHKHIYDQQHPYEFKSIDKLLEDFKTDVSLARRFMRCVEEP